MAGTRWVRLDLDYFTNPKTVAAGRDGQLLHLASICWAGQHLTDGHIPATTVPGLLAVARVDRRAVDKVVAAGLWIPTAGSDFYIKDYLERNPSKGDVERERDQWRERQRRRRGEDGRFLPHE